MNFHMLGGGGGRMDCMDSQHGTLGRYLRGKTVRSLRALLLLLPGLAYAQAPDNSWNLTDTSDTLGFAEDCTGAAVQTDAAEFTDPVTGAVCQNYTNVSLGPTDVYESLEADGGGFCDSDIETYRLGKDDTFFYFEIETTGSWDCDDSGESNKYALEVDVDFLTEAGPRNDIFYSYEPKAEHLSSTWQASDESAPIKAFRDESSSPADRVGSTQPLACDKDGESLCTTSNGSDSGYDEDYKDTGGTGNNSFNWYRIITRNGKNIVQLAIRANTLCAPPASPPCTAPDDIASRVWATQSSSLSGDELAWHDHFNVSDLDGAKFDNCCGIGDEPTTPVSLAFVHARRASGGEVIVDWMTATELGNVGFELFALRDGSQRRLGPGLVPARAAGPTSPTWYSARVFLEPGETLVIEDRDIRGRTQRHGPFVVGRVHGDPADALTPIDWPALRREHESAARKRLERKRAGANPVIHLGVTQDGIHRLYHRDLLAAGIDLSGTQADALALAAGGRPVHRHVGGPATFGPGSFIEFVGRKLDTLYTDENVYTLTIDPNRALRPGPFAPRNSLDEPARASYRATRRFEEDRRYDPAAIGPDPWYHQRLLARDDPVSFELPLALDDRVAGAGTVELTVALWGVTNFPATPDHHVLIEVNDVVLADLLFDGLQDATTTLGLPDDLLEPGGNRLRIVLPNDTAAPLDLVYYESHTLRYPRSFEAIDGSLSFTAGGPVFEVSNLPGPEIVAYMDHDATGAQDDGERLFGSGFEATQRRIEAIEVTADGESYRARFAGQRKPATYHVAALQSVPAPTISLAPAADPLTDLPADLLLIAHPDFVAGLDAFVGAREAAGLGVAVVDVATIYARYSHGVVDPGAIHRFIIDAAGSNPDLAVLLVGGDSYDYRDNLGLGAFSFVPTLYAQTGEIVRFAPVDPLYGDIDGDRIPDVPIGRWPVRTRAELAAVIERTLAYETIDFPRTMVAVADDLDGPGAFSFRDASNAILSELTDSWTIDRVYLDSVTVDGAREALTGAINRGAAVTSFFGHSGPTVWTFDGLFRAADADQLDNAGRPTVVMQWGCWNTYLVAPRYDTLGHRFMLNPGIGAAAVLGASTLTRAASEERLARFLFEELVNQRQSLGAALIRAKRAVAAVNPDLTDVLLGWTILGDPTLVVEP